MPRADDINLGISNYNHALDPSEWCNALSVCVGPAGEVQAAHCYLSFRG